MGGIWTHGRIASHNRFRVYAVMTTSAPLHHKFYKIKRLEHNCSSLYILERVAGIEPAQSAWKAEILPLNYTRNSYCFIIIPFSNKKVNTFFKIFIY